MSTVTDDAGEGPSGGYNVVVSRGRALYIAQRGPVRGEAPSPAAEPARELVQAANDTLPLIDRLLQSMPPPATKSHAGGDEAAPSVPPGTFRFAEEDYDTQWRNDRDSHIEHNTDTDERWAFEPCAKPETSAETSPYATDKLRTRMVSLTRSAPEYGQELQLAHYPTSAAAAAVLRDFREALDKCRDTTHNETRWIWSDEKLDAGDEAFLALVRYELVGAGPVPGINQVAVVRIENAVFLHAVGGEMSAPEVRDELMSSVRMNAARICELHDCSH